MRFLGIFIALWAGLGFILVGCTKADETRRPLRVVLIPADGGTEDGTKADYQPIFNAISLMIDRDFDIKVGQSYAAVVEAMCNNGADIAFVGPVTYLQAQERGCAELLAVGVQDGRSVYYAGLFTTEHSSIRKISDLKTQRVAFGDINSASSFIYPVAMIVKSGLDPVHDLGAIHMTASHADSLAAIVHGHADAAALSFDSYEKAVNEGVVDSTSIRLIAKSPPIPYPPLILNAQMDPALKAKLRSAFAGVADARGVTPEMIRGYGGKKIDRYDTQFDSEQFKQTSAVMAEVDNALKMAILKKASVR